jgi:hypothetical protein
LLHFAKGALPRGLDGVEASVFATMTCSLPTSARKSRRKRHFERQLNAPFHWLNAAGAWLIVSLISRSTSRTRKSLFGGVAVAAAPPACWRASSRATASLPAVLCRARNDAAEVGAARLAFAAARLFPPRDRPRCAAPYPFVGG